MDKNRDRNAEDMVQVSIQVETMDMFFFMLQHTYHSISGICGILFSVAAFVILLWTWGTVDTAYMVLLAVCSALFTIVNPLMLFMKAAKQVVLNPAVKTPVFYLFGKEAFTMKQGKEEASAEYRSLYRVRNTKNYIYLYGTGTRANIISKKQLGEQAQRVTELIMDGIR